jgi:hypothetical protein
MCRGVLLVTVMWPSVFGLTAVAPHAFVVLSHNFFFILGMPHYSK